MTAGVQVAVQAVWVFGLMFALDFIWVFYTKAVSGERRLESAAWAALIPVISGLLVLCYVDRPLMILPAAFGAFCGTFCAGRK